MIAGALAVLTKCVKAMAERLAVHDGQGVSRDETVLWMELLEKGELFKRLP